ncbi:MAG TPA: Rnf-Nqr domain containing protein [Steroidobacteraceae bacterium]|jgi:H+/Na+-translocating ferredoxin:NAD+ oxidoreductase subunit E|nr:Rnf-Nqr domain containing protein [Steroidobacteraceae bacterium]
MSAGSSSRFGSTARLIAVCPLLAMSDTVADALGIGVVVLIVVPLATAVLALLRSRLTSETALPASMLTIAALVACVELLLSAWFSELRTALTLFVPLIVSNLIAVQHLQARHESLGKALAGSLQIAAGIAVTLLPLGIARELVGRGSLLHDAGNLLGAHWAELSVFRVDMGFLLAMLPPGAFISFGLLLAARNWIIQRRS